MKEHEELQQEEEKVSDVEKRLDEQFSRTLTSVTQTIQRQFERLERTCPGFYARNGITEIYGTPIVDINLGNNKPNDTTTIINENKQQQQSEKKTKQFVPGEIKQEDKKAKAAMQGNILPFALNITPDTTAPAGTQHYIQPDFSACYADHIKQYYDNVIASLPTASPVAQQPNMYQQMQPQDVQQPQVIPQNIPQVQPQVILTQNLHNDECNCGHDHHKEEVESAEAMTQRLKNQFPILSNVERLIYENNCTCQFGTEGNGLIFVMVGDDKSIMDQSRFFAIDLGGNILNRKFKWFPCALPAIGYGYEDYPCYELKIEEGSTLEYFIRKEMPDDAQMIVKPDQIELNKYVDVVNMSKCDNTARASIISRLKNAMKKGMFEQVNAGMWGTRYRISDIVDGNNFTLVNDAPIRFGYPVVIPAKKIEIKFNFSKADIIQM